MSKKSAARLNLNPTMVAAARPGLENTVKELQECLDRVEALQDSFRENFLKIFETDNPPTSDGHSAGTALSNIYFFTHANLGGNAVSHLRYAADLADMACELLNDFKCD